MVCYRRFREERELTATFLVKVRDSAKTFAGRAGTRWETTPRKGVENRLAPLRLALAAGLAASLLLSPNLWVSTRSYPLTPLWGAVPPLPYPTNYVLFGLFLALVAGVGVVRGVQWGGSRAARWLLRRSSLGDESRLQPWFYQYSFMLAALACTGGAVSEPRTRSTPAA